MMKKIKKRTSQENKNTGLQIQSSITIQNFKNYKVRRNIESSFYILYFIFFYVFIILFIYLFIFIIIYY